MGEQGHSVTSSMPGPSQPAAAPCQTPRAMLGCVVILGKNIRVTLQQKD